MMGAKLLGLVFAFGCLMAVNVANAGTISGKVRYYDSRGARSAASGSKVTQSTLNSQPVVPFPKIYFYDQDGSCQDFTPTCSENDDDYLGWDEGDLFGNY